MSLLRFFLNRFRGMKSFFWTCLVRRTCGNLKGRVKVNGASRIGKNVNLGHNVSFNGMFISPKGSVTIGDNFHSGKECQILASFHNYLGEQLPYDSTLIEKEVQIGDNVWFGNRVMVLGQVSIGEGAIVQAGAVVTSDIPPLGIAGGNPAKVFKYRDKDHYFQLKKAEKFH